MCLAAHFALWNASLGLTTVAAATTLVSCAPLFVGVGSVLLGRRRAPAWAGIVLATAGAVVIGLGDAAGFGGGSGAVLGDVLAFAGALAMAAYLLLGRVARQRLPVSTYATSVYGVAAAVLLPACLLTGSSLGGYPPASWLALAGVVAGPPARPHRVQRAAGHRERHGGGPGPAARTGCRHRPGLVAVGRAARPGLLGRRPHGPGRGVAGHDRLATDVGCCEVQPPEHPKQAGKRAQTMPGTILVGSQWGDEGKGKATDLLADKMDVVVRYQGGNNAGHTVIVEGRTFKLTWSPAASCTPTSPR